VDAQGYRYDPDQLSDLESMLRRHVSGELGGMQIADVRGGELRALVGRLDTAGFPQASTRSLIRAMRALLGFAAQRGLASSSAADTLVFGDEEDLSYVAEAQRRRAPAPPPPPTFPPTFPPPAPSPTFPPGPAPPFPPAPSQAFPPAPSQTFPPAAPPPPASGSYPQYAQYPQPQYPPYPEEQPRVGGTASVPDEVIWMILKIVTLVFVLIALVLVAESV
jgi:hypothetical protein